MDGWLHNGAMPYELFLWDGERPASLREAEATVDRLTDGFLASHEPPTPGLAAFVDALLARYPDMNTPDGTGGSWASAPLTTWARGALAYLLINAVHAEQVSAVVVELGQQHGLNCFDPQLGQMRPMTATHPWLTVTAADPTGPGNPQTGR